MQERIAFRRPEGLGGSQLLVASGSRRRWSMAHETVTLGLVTGGLGKWRCRGTDGVLRPGLVLLIAPGDVHSTRAVDRPGAFSALFLPPEVVRRCVFPDHATAERIHFRRIEADDAATFAAMQRLATAAAAPQVDAFELSQLAALSLGLVFERHASDVPPVTTAPPETVLRAADLIRAAFDDDPSTPGLTVESIASTSGVSGPSLIRGFRNAMGLPPYQFLLRLRFERARQMVGDGPNDGDGIANFTDISQACGFYDLSHMGRVFRKVIGVAPAHYAAQIGVLDTWNERRRA